MIIDPYETTFGSVYNATALRTRVSETLAHEFDSKVFFTPTFEGQALTSVKAISHADGNQVLNHFTQPCIAQYRGEQYVVVDTRPFLAHERDGTVTIRENADFNLMVLRGALTAACLGKNDRGRNTMMGLLRPSWRIFDQLVTSSIVNSTNLRGDLQVKGRISILTAIYWLQVFSDYDILEDSDRTLVQLSRFCNYPPQEISSVMGAISKINTIEDFAKSLFPATGNTRLQKVTMQTFFEMVRNCWFGTDAREMVGVSLEHPPTFLAMIYTVLVSRNFKRTMFHQRVNDIRDRTLRVSLEDAIRRLVHSSSL